MSDFADALNRATNDRDRALEYAAWAEPLLFAGAETLVEVPVALSASVRDFLEKVPTRLQGAGFLLDPPRMSVIKVDYQVVPEHRAVRLLVTPDKNVPVVPMPGAHKQDQWGTWSPNLFELALRRSRQESVRKRALRAWAETGKPTRFVSVPYQRYENDVPFVMTVDGRWCNITPEDAADQRIYRLLTEALVRFAMKERLG